MARYVMREKMFSIGDDFWIEDDAGEKTYKVDGKKLRVRKTFVLENRAGQEVAKVVEKKLSVRDAMRIERNGDTIATVRKKLIHGPFRDRYVVDMKDGENLTAKGSILDRDYKIERDGKKVAEVSKKWFRIRDAYGLEIEAGEDVPLIIAAAVCLEELGRGDLD